MSRDSEPKNFFSKEEEQKMIVAIREAEKKTSGEIRIHLERKIEGDLFVHAAKVFEQLGMTQTKERNGVLIFFVIQSHQFVILGDAGIHEKVRQGFWDDEARKMSDYFKRDQFVEGIILTVKQVGTKLQSYFPYQDRDINELPDVISYSD